MYICGNKHQSTIMKIRGTRPITVKKYAQVAGVIRELCMMQKPVDFRAIAKKHRVGNQATYTLITLGIVENISSPGGIGKGMYAWRNPNNLSDVEIANQLIHYVAQMRIAKGKRIKPSRSPSQTVLTAFSSAAPPQVVKDKPKQVIQRANGSNVNVVRLKLFGLTIFECEKRGKN